MWWAALSGFIAAGGGSACPCCGTAGSPVAPALAGLLGGVVAALVFLLRRLLCLFQVGGVGHKGRRCFSRALPIVFSTMSRWLPGAPQGTRR